MNLTGWALGSGGLRDFWGTTPRNAKWPHGRSNLQLCDPRISSSAFREYNVKIMGTCVYTSLTDSQRTSNTASLNEAIWRKMMNIFFLRNCVRVVTGSWRSPHGLHSSSYTADSLVLMTKQLVIFKRSHFPPPRNQTMLFTHCSSQQNALL